MWAISGMGDVILHCGQMMHGGAALTSGIRYILVGFVDVVAPDVHAIIERAQELRAAEEEAAEAAEAAEAVEAAEAAEAAEA